MPATKLIAGALARDRAADTALAALGVATAVGSLCFAGYMIVIGPGHREPHEQDGRFTATAPVRLSAAGNTLPAATAGFDTVDFAPTGTIPPGHEAAAVVQPQPSPEAVLRDFAVRDVFDGTALVELHGALHMVSLGDTLEGAGKVLAIERRGRGWMVRTAGGTIRQRR